MLQRFSSFKLASAASGETQLFSYQNINMITFIRNIQHASQKKFPSQNKHLTKMQVQLAYTKALLGPCRVPLRKKFPNSPSQTLVSYFDILYQHTVRFVFE